MSKHTETPWEVGQSNIIFVGTGVGDPIKQSVVAHIYGGREHALVDAALIVRAVNAHEGLVRALASIAEDCRRGAHELGMTPAGVRDIAARCDAALSAAKE